MNHLKIRRRLYPWARRIHLHLSLVLGLVFIGLALSGTALVYRAEIERWLSEPIEWDGQTKADWRSVEAQAIAARPDAPLMMLWFPTEKRPYYEAAYLYRGQEYAGALYFHPASGRRIHRANTAFFETVEAFHETLLLGEIGEWLVAWSTLFFGIVLLTGMFLWWPGWKLQRWLKIRRGRAWLFDSHRALGFLAAPFLLLMALTGLVMVFPAQLEPIVYRLTGAEPPETAGEELWRLKSEIPPTDKRDAATESLIAQARDLSAASAMVFYVSYPISPEESRQVRMQDGYSPPPFGRVSVFYFDRYSGTLLGQTGESESAADAYLNGWNAALHLGTFGGHASKAVWFISSALTLYFAWSGVVMWRR